MGEHARRRERTYLRRLEFQKDFVEVDVVEVEAQLIKLSSGRSRGDLSPGPQTSFWWAARVSILAPWELG